MQEAEVRAPKAPITACAVYTRREAASLTGLSIITLLRHEKRGLLSGRRLGRAVRYLGEDLLAYVRGAATTKAKGGVR